MMHSRRNLYFFLICAVAGAVAAAAVTVVRNRMVRQYTEDWKLEQPVAYTEEIRGQLEELEEEGNACVYWHRKKGIIAEDPETGRRTKIALYYIAGSSCALFPDENGLSVPDSGKCLLSGDMAWELFGSTDIAGKKVLADGKEYIVGGVIFQKEGVCVCELEAGDRRKLTHASVLCGSGRERQLCRQRMNIHL